jgi:Protein of unknown function (DUF3237)
VELLRLMEIDVAVQPMVDFGDSPSGHRRLVVFDGGTFDGRDGLHGTVASGGVDWQIVRPDGVIEIDAHYVLDTNEGESIEVRSTGIRKASVAVADRLAHGEEVEPSEYYFRTHVRLLTSAIRLVWMNDLIAVSTGERRQGSVRISVHEVL